MSATARETLREMVEREIRKVSGVGDTLGLFVRPQDAVEVALRLLSEQQETVNALEITQDESDECAAELFGLVCAVVDGKPEAADARDRLQKHIEHVRACRKGSCDTELHGSRLRQRLIEKWGHVAGCKCSFVRDDGDNPTLLVRSDPRCAQPGGEEE